MAPEVPAEIMAAMPGFAPWYTSKAQPLAGNCFISIKNESNTMKMAMTTTLMPECRMLL